MKLFSHRKSKRTVCAALSAAMLIFSAVSPYAVNAAPETSETSTAAESDKKSDPKMEELDIYRWSVVSKTNFPNDNKWHLAMLFRVWKGKIEGPYLNGKVPEQLWLGSNPQYTPQGLDRSKIQTYNKNSPGWGKIDKDDVAESTTHYLKCSNVYGVNDNEVNPNVNVFYTFNDRDCISVRYLNDSTKRKNSDNTNAPQYEVKFKSTNKYDYYMWGKVDGDNDANMWALTEKDSADLARSIKDKTYDKIDCSNRWCFLQEENKDGKDFWNIVAEQKSHDTWLWGSGSDDYNSYWFYGRDKKTDDSRFLWYEGTRLRYSAYRDTVTTIPEGQMHIVTQNEFTDDEGKPNTTGGTILKAGRKLVINKGAVVSISGHFINNGTILINGGTLLIRENGAVFPYNPGGNNAKNGCGSVKVINGGTIIIQNGGALYAGLSDSDGNPVDFSLDSNATIINQGLLVYGSMKVGERSRVEMYEESSAFGGYFPMVSVSLYVETKKFKSLAEAKKQYSDFEYVGTEDKKYVFVRYENLPNTDMYVFYNGYFLGKYGENECPLLNEVDLPSSIGKSGMIKKSDNITVKKASNNKRCYLKDEYYKKNGIKVEDLGL